MFMKCENEHLGLCEMAWETMKMSSRLWDPKGGPENAECVRHRWIGSVLKTLKNRTLEKKAYCAGQVYWMNYCWFIKIQDELLPVYQNTGISSQKKMYAHIRR